MKNIEGNILIAEFLGVGNLYEAQSSNMFNKYHESWDKLMPIVEKIEKLNYFVMAYEFLDDETGEKSGEFWSQVSNNLKVDIESLINITGQSSKIQATYSAVVEFIKWYNTQSK